MLASSVECALSTEMCLVKEKKFMLRQDGLHHNLYRCRSRSSFMSLTEMSLHCKE